LHLQARQRYPGQQNPMPPLHTLTRPSLARPWSERRPDGYDVVIIGSGYGGAIAAARLATADWPDGRPAVCVLERGREWLPGQFPDRLLDEGVEAVYHESLNPLGLYKVQAGPDIVPVMGSGLGGTSLINANVAIEPDPDLFQRPPWPAAIARVAQSGQLAAYFERVRMTLGAGTHPDALELGKVQALRQGALGKPQAEFFPLHIAVNFEPDGPNRWGALQRRCINCGDCVTGCNVGAKNTLDTNYLAIAKHGGADLFPQVEARHLEPDPGGGYRIHYRRRELSGGLEEGVLWARRAVVLAGGSIGSTELLLRSRERGLSLPDTVGSRFSGNGDFFGLAYNANQRVNALGWGAFPDSDRARRINPPGRLLNPGPTIVSAVRYQRSGAVAERVLVEDLSFPLMYVDAARAAFAVVSGRDTDAGDSLEEFGRRLLDFGALNPQLERGALNYTLMYLVMGMDDAGGRMELDGPGGSVRLRWPGAGGQPVFKLENATIEDHAAVLGSTFIQSPLWGLSPFRTLMTAHPLGGCPMAEDHTVGVVNDLGQVFTAQGGFHEGLYVADGSILGTALGVNPFLTISALAERIAEGVITALGGAPRVLEQIEAGAAAGGR